MPIPPSVQCVSSQCNVVTVWDLFLERCALDLRMPLEVNVSSMVRGPRVPPLPQRSLAKCTPAVRDGDASALRPASWSGPDGTPWHRDSRAMVSRGVAHTRASLRAVPPPPPLSKQRLCADAPMQAMHVAAPPRDT